MDAQTMEHLRTKLLNRRELSLGRHGRLLAEQQELTASRATEVAHLNGLARLEAQALERIEASLERMEKGTYGKCAVCRAAVETERLRAMPDVTHCAGCTH